MLVAPLAVAIYRLLQMPAHAHAQAMANLEDDRAERFRELVIAEHRVCAREHKLLKSMLGDGRCGWYMAAHLLLGDARKWMHSGPWFKALAKNVVG